MRETMRLPTPIGLLLAPKAFLEAVAADAPSASSVFWRKLLWLALLPPLFAFVGAANFGWRLGAEAPLAIGTAQLAVISLCYFLALVAGFFGAALAGRWMAPTYGASAALGRHLALVAAVAAPLAVGSAAHLFPHVFLNMLVLIPALVWSLYRLYAGLPTALGTSPEQGMLMASSLIGFLLVAAVTLLGATVALWAAGIGPAMGI